MPRRTKPEEQQAPAEPVPQFTDADWEGVECSPIFRRDATFTPDHAKRTGYINIYRDLWPGSCPWVARVDRPKLGDVDDAWIQRELGGLPEGTRYMLEAGAGGGGYVKRAWTCVAGGGLVAPKSPRPSSTAVIGSAHAPPPAAQPQTDLASVVQLMREMNAENLKTLRDMFGDFVKQTEDRIKLEKERVDALEKSIRAPEPLSEADKIRAELEVTRLRLEHKIEMRKLEKRMKTIDEEENGDDDEAGSDDGPPSTPVAMAQWALKKWGPKRLRDELGPMLPALLGSGNGTPRADE